jgi:hypothetical protein
MSENESAPIEETGETGEVQLPPMLGKFRSDLRTSRKKLLRDKGQGGKPVFADPEQLRIFVAQYVYPQMIQMMELLGPALNDTYAFAASNADDIRRLHRAFKDRLGDERDDGPSMETVQELAAAMYELGALLQKKLPGDTELEATFNSVSKKIEDLLEQMTASPDDDDEGDDYEDDDDDEEDGDDDDDEEDDESASVSAAPKSPSRKKPSKKPASKKPEPPASPEAPEVTP